MERKLATVLFVDLVDSTSLVSANDPEVVRRRVTRFFDHVSRCIETHGGKVEKFAGDSVMAAFGIPQAHEDDAERAVRAALGILESMGELELDARIGLESGEVVTDVGDSTFATGEAVNLAARLQQNAEPGQILVGPAAHRLTLGRVEVEEIGPVDVRGREDPVWAWAAVSADGRQPARVAVTPLIGRDHELELLENTFARAVRDRRAHLFTVYGEPGVGKTRLTNEFLASLEGTTILAGRCLPYGESITYWPLAEMVKGAADIADDDPLDVAIAKLRECCPADAVADLLGLATGVLEAVHGERSQQEIAWAAREWAQLMAQTQPLILVFEDIHWAEEPLLELIEHMTDWVRDGSLLIVCLSRPELLDVRSDWGGGRVRATSIELEPLGEADSEQLIDALSEVGEISPATRRALLDKTGGNPLFLEEVMLTVAECGEEEAAAGIPDTLQALIAARIDRLEPESKALLQRASVIGRSFWAGALEYLSSGESVEEPLEDLQLRDLVVQQLRSSLSNETAYRFKHVLIRDVAYAGLTKSVRAGHHARFAQWLRERAGDELLEIRAHHLDHAASLLADLDGAPPADLAREAAETLQEAGRRALAREANQAARNSFLRAVELEPTLERRYLAAKAAWRLDDLPAVTREMENVREEAVRGGDRPLEGKALTALADMVLMREADPLRAREIADQALTAIADSDPAARFDALGVAWHAAYWVGHLSDAEHYLTEQLTLACAAGRKDLESIAVLTRADTFWARLELDEARALLQEARVLAEESGTINSRGRVLLSWAKVYLLLGHLEQADEAAQEAIRLFSEAGAVWAIARSLNISAWVSWGSGSLEKGEKQFRESIRLLKPIGDRATLCESQRGLAELLLERGRVEEAERFALEARETVGLRDVTSRATTAASLAMVRAAQERHEEAEELFQAAFDAVVGTDFRQIELEVLDRYAPFLRDRGREEDADRAEERRAELLPAAPKSSARIA
ncbi:MAG TPA: adenylate/guanylate cyclase domain-containing protein [Gaiellaceae bacterium]|nr:adenylate/guanylate cyclase domain-containing protein [Gaiellaceae bacterium]